MYNDGCGGCCNKKNAAGFTVMDEVFVRSFSVRIYTTITDFTVLVEADSDDCKKAAAAMGTLPETVSAAALKIGAAKLTENKLYGEEN